MSKRHFEKVIRYFRSQANLARLLGVHRVSLNSWYKKKAKMPILYAIKIDIMTDGLFPYSDFLDRETKAYLKKKLIKVGDRDVV